MDWRAPDEGIRSQRHGAGGRHEGPPADAYIAQWRAPGEERNEPPARPVGAGGNADDVPGDGPADGNAEPEGPAAGVGAGGGSSAAEEGADGSAGGSGAAEGGADGSGGGAPPPLSGEPRPAGRSGPRLLAAWVLILTGIGLLLVTSVLAGAGSSDAGLFGLAGLVAISLGFIAAAGYQLASRAGRPAGTYRGPAPILLFVIVLLLTTLAVGVLLAVGLPNPTEAPIAALISLFVQEGMYAFVVWLLVVRTGALRWREMGWPSWPERGERTLVRDAAVGVAMVVPIYLGTVLVGSYLSAILGVQLSSPLPTPSTSLGDVAVALSAVVLAPIGEELFFRGFSLTAWRRDLGERAALVRATLFFAFVHVLNVVPTGLAEGLKLALLQFLVIVPVAWVLGILFLRRGIVASIAGHMAFNSIAVILLLASLARGG